MYAELHHWKEDKEGGLTGHMKNDVCMHLFPSPVCSAEDLKRKHGDAQTNISTLKSNGFRFAYIEKIVNQIEVNWPELSSACLFGRIYFNCMHTYLDTMIGWDGDLNG